MFFLASNHRTGDRFGLVVVTVAVQKQRKPKQKQKNRFLVGLDLDGFLIGFL